VKTDRCRTHRAIVAQLAVALPVALGSAPARPVEDWLPPVVEIPYGRFIAGSDRRERELAYRLDERAYGEPITRRERWYEGERQRRRVSLHAYAITLTPITNRQYTAFVAETGHRVPEVDRATWAVYGLAHPYERTRRHARREGKPPVGRGNHPVVLVSLADAAAYAEWLSRKTGVRWRLPTELEWEKAARGTDGRAFPWGAEFDPSRLNSHDAGPFDTTPAGVYPSGASPFGVLDAAGQVYEWTATLAAPGRAIVKGGLLGRQGLRRVPAHGAACKAGRAQAHPYRLPAGAPSAPSFPYCGTGSTPL
jgi:formylglycine-generating enzyme required for sulfatase activity